MAFLPLPSEFAAGSKPSARYPAAPAWQGGCIPAHLCLSHPAPFFWGGGVSQIPPLHQMASVLAEVKTTPDARPSPPENVPPKPLPLGVKPPFPRKREPETTLVSRGALWWWAGWSLFSPTTTTPSPSRPTAARGSSPHRPQQQHWLGRPYRFTSWVCFSASGFVTTRRVSSGENVKIL